VLCIVCTQLRHWQELEKSESELLRSIMFSSSPNGFTVRAGIEATLKNRYNDIWPFDHNRIVLQSSGGDSYINASYIEASVLFPICAIV
jgi:protein tyrosine phosphatase